MHELQVNDLMRPDGKDDIESTAGEVRHATLAPAEPTCWLSEVLHHAN